MNDLIYGIFEDFPVFPPPTINWYLHNFLVHVQNQVQGIPFFSLLHLFPTSFLPTPTPKSCVKICEGPRMVRFMLRWGFWTIFLPSWKGPLKKFFSLRVTAGNCLSFLEGAAILLNSVMWSRDSRQDPGSQIVGTLFCSLHTQDLNLAKSLELSLQKRDLPLTSGNRPYRPPIRRLWST